MSQQAEGRLTPTPTPARGGWKLNVPTEAPQLSDDRLLAYRHHGEHLSLAVGIAFLVGGLIAATMLGQKEILLGFVVIWASMILTSMQAPTRNMLRGAEVTPTQFPAIHEIAQELTRRFGTPPTRIFVVRMLSLKAQTLGFKAPYVIVLPSLLLDMLSSDELRFVLGQQFGRIHFGQTRSDILLGGDEFTLPPVLSWVAKLRDLVFGWHHRVAAISADRAGILACGSVAVAIRTQINLDVGTTRYGESQPGDLVEQAFKLTQGMSRLQATMIRLQSKTLPLVPRLEAMVAWAGLPERPQDPVG